MTDDTSAQARPSTDEEEDERIARLESEIGELKDVLHTVAQRLNDELTAVEEELAQADAENLELRNRLAMVAAMASTGATHPADDERLAALDALEERVGRLEPLAEQLAADARTPQEARNRAAEGVGTRDCRAEEADEEADDAREGAA